MNKEEEDDDMDDIFKIMDKLFNDMLYGGYKFRDDSVYNYTTFPSNRIYTNVTKKEDIADSLIDASQDEKFIYITIELRGVREEDLTVTPKAESIYIRVVIDGKVLERDYPLPYRVNPKTAQVKFNNCILDVVLKKVKERKKKDGLRQSV